MRTRIATALLVTTLATPALAQSYPVSGKWGEINGAQKGPIDCTDRRRVIDFNANNEPTIMAAGRNNRTKPGRVMAKPDYRSSVESGTERAVPGRRKTSLARINPTGTEW